MTQAKTPLLSDAEHQKLAEALVNAKTDGDRLQVMTRIERLAKEGAIDEEKLFGYIQKMQQTPSKPASQPQSQPRQESSSSSSSSSRGGGSSTSHSPSAGGGSSDRAKDKTLVFGFRVLRGLVLATNVMPYRVVLQNLLPQTAIVEVYQWLSGVPLLGKLVLTILAGVLWYVLQNLETLSGRDTWLVKWPAYVADAFMCIATFPPLIGGLGAASLFLFAGTASDIDWPNLAICIFAIGAWEALNWTEKKVFKGCSFGFWGVKTK